ncbi:hypothetical protein KBD71_03345 [Candidatus Woesebacteria bacterium]|nr:hypothetical protein [Candidatus Woesebacteria bacterium]
MASSSFADYRRVLHRRRSSSVSYQPTSVGWQRFLTHPLIIGVWTLACLFFGIGLIRSGLSVRQVVERKTQAEEQLSTEESRGMQLIQDLEESNSSYAKEKIIREELRMQLPGETILQLASPSSTPSN